MLKLEETSSKSYLTKDITVPFKYVIKRTGERVDFNLNKIIKAMEAASVESSTSIDYDIVVSSIISGVLGNYSSTISDPANIIPDIEIIQDQTIKSLERLYPNVAKKFNDYREERRVFREKNIDSTIKLIDGYIDNEDWKIKENSNTSYSFQGLNNLICNDAMKTYWLHKIYDKDIRNAHESGDLHVHDLGSLASYCVGWSLEDLLLRGFNGLKDKVASGPAKHFDTALGQIFNFIYSTQGETAGAQALSSVDTYLAPFIRYDNLTYKEVKQDMQKWLHNMNTSTRVGFQAVFSNVTLDLECPKGMKDKPAIIGGEYIDNTYGEYQEEMDLFNKAFCECMVQGDYEGKVFNFPIPTYNITKEFNWDNENHNPIWEMTGKYGIPYFTNYINSDLDPEDARSMCPIHPDEEVDVLIDGTLYNAITIGALAELKDKVPNTELKVKDQDNNWQVADLNTFNVTKMFKITFANGISVRLDGVHQQPIVKDDNVVSVSVNKLKVGDKTLFINKESASIYYVKIKHIDEIPYEGKVHCFELYNEMRLFQLSSGLITYNCRLRLDLTELNHRGGGLFGSGSLTGSIGVVTLNLPRIGYLAENKREYFELLDEKLYLAKRSLEEKRKFIEKMTEQGLYPYCKVYLSAIKEARGGYWTNHFSTIGILGMHESCLNFLGKGIYDKEGKDFTLLVQDHIRNKLIEFQAETGHMYNFEATPGEGLAYRFFKLDKIRYDMKLSRPDAEYYTNSTNLPVGYTENLFEALEHQNDLQKMYTGGTVFHGFIPEPIEDKEVVKQIIKGALSNSEVPYVSLTPTFSICPRHGYLPGEFFNCTHEGCTRDCEVYTRVVGYYSPVNNWNKGKRCEFGHRNEYELEFEKILNDIK